MVRPINVLRHDYAPELEIPRLIAPRAVTRLLFPRANFFRVAFLVKLFYTDHFVLPLPDEHPFPMSKYRLLRERIVAADWARDCELLVPDAATDDELQLAHCEDYIERVVRGQLTDKEVKRIGFPWSSELVQRSRRSTGATIAAARAASRDGVSANLAGGTHHAFRDRGEGYCVFNDVAVAARVMQRDGASMSILIVDCDVHQGNGTAEIFAGDPSVTTFSMHGLRNYPLKKTASDLDIALPNGTGDQEYLSRLELALARLLRAPYDFVFYLAGADPYEKDRLGRLALSKEGLRHRDEIVLSRCREMRLPVAIVMAGGYAEDVDEIVDIHATTIRCAMSFADS